MAVGTNRWKLGLFVLAAGAVFVLALVAFGASSWNERTVTYFAFFDESVQGLDPGSPVKFRGVTIGRVADIEVAPDHRHVQTELDFSVTELEKLGLDSLRHPEKIPAPGALRVQLASTGLTGVKFVLLDFFEPSQGPITKLPFPHPVNTLPTTPSTLKGLEDAVVRSADRFPEIATQLLGSVTRLNALLDSIEQERLPARAASTIGAADATLAELRTQVRALRTAELSDQLARNLDQFEHTLQGVDRIVARLDSDAGLMKTAERAVSSLDEVARGAQTVGPEMQLTLREVRGAARSIRRLADALERDPDMLVKGRATAAQ